MNKSGWGWATGRNEKKKSGSYELEPTSLPLPKLAGKSAKMQRCKPSLGVHLAVSKLLWELRAGILEQAIPLCLSFCLSVLNSPSALIHSHIQFPALSIHQSPHFVSADFIPALTITLQPSPGHRGPPPQCPQPPPASRP